LKEIGFSVFLIGLLEGIAELTAGLSKGYFGKQSDEKGVRLPFIKSGYFLSAISKPMMAVFSLPIWIFIARTVDRLGKGLRTAARDALLSDNATPQTKARVFGFHRGLDTLGAFLGPIIALGFLYFFPQQYKPLFYWALLPGMVSIALIYLLKEVPKPDSTIKKGNFFSYFTYWKIAKPEYKKLVAGLLLFSLFNSSDVFLLLKTKEVTGSDTFTITAYIFYNLVYAIASYPLGLLADKTGMKKIFLSGLLLFALVYFLFGIGQSPSLIFLAFFLYALYAAATEGIGKAWITNLSHDVNTATAIGFYTSCQSICTLLASSLAGLLWISFGSTTVFLTTSFITFCVAGYFILVVKQSSN
jgi:MFS family permease